MLLMSSRLATPAPGGIVALPPLTPLAPESPSRLSVSPRVIRVPTHLAAPFASSLTLLISCLVLYESNGSVNWK